MNIDFGHPDYETARQVASLAMTRAELALVRGDERAFQAQYAIGREAIEEYFFERNLGYQTAVSELVGVRIANALEEHLEVVTFGDLANVTSAQLDVVPNFGPAAKARVIQSLQRVHDAELRRKAETDESHGMGKCPVDRRAD